MTEQKQYITYHIPDASWGVNMRELFNENHDPETGQFAEGGGSGGGSSGSGDNGGGTATGGSSSGSSNVSAGAKASLRPNHSEYEEKRMSQLENEMKDKRDFVQKHGASTILSESKTSPDLSDADVAQYMKERNYPNYSIDRQNDMIMARQSSGNELGIPIDNAKEYFDEHVANAWKDHYSKNLAKK